MENKDLSKEALFEQYKNYIYQICEDDLLRQTCLDYFKNLQNINYKLTKENLDYLRFRTNGKLKIYKQQIEKEFFNIKDEVPIADLFFYLLKTNINSIRCVDKMEISDLKIKRKFSGTIDATTKKILINIGIEDDKLKEKNFYPTLKNEICKSCQDLKKAHIQEILNHELSHIFQIKNYGDYVNFGYCDFIEHFDLGSKSRETINLNFSANRSINQAIIHGTKYINEVFTDYLNGIIKNTRNIENNSESVLKYLHNSRNYTHSVVHKNNNYIWNGSSYLLTSYIIPYLNSFLGEFSVYDFNLKSNYYKNILKHAKLDDNLRQKIVEIIAKNETKNIALSKNKRNIEYDFDSNYDEIYKKIDSLRIDSILYFLFTKTVNNYENNSFHFEKCEDCVEAICLNIYKNKLNADFANPDIEKNAKFFNDINENLKSMKRFVFMINWLSKINVRNTQTGYIEVKILKDVASIQGLAERFEKKLHIKEFNNLLIDIENNINNLPLNVQKIATAKIDFLTKEKELNEKYIILNIVKNTTNVETKI